MNIKDLQPVEAGFTQDNRDLRLIEAGFPCHQVGAETQRERGASSALPPLYFLHVWWARRPLTPSRAAIIASLDPAGTDPETFVRQLGIERVQALVGGEPWILTGDLLQRLEKGLDGSEVLRVDKAVLRALGKENGRRAENRELIDELKAKGPELANDPMLLRWEQESQPLPYALVAEGGVLPVRRVMGDPAWAKDKMAFTQMHGIRFPGDAYGYGRAFATSKPYVATGFTVLDPTAGGGSIPFEALRLGHNVIANELNPVATTILYGTLDYPARFGLVLADDIKTCGKQLLAATDALADVFADQGTLPPQEKSALVKTLGSKNQELVDQFDRELIADYLYTRQVTCPHCHSKAPLLNTCWLSKEAGDPWGVKIIPDGKPRQGTVRFETYRISKGHGPNGEDPHFATVNRGIGQCIHCKQAVDGDEIKAQARGEGGFRWQDRLYAVVAIRLQPKLDKHGKPQYFKSGERAGEIKTEKVRYFRAPNERDLAALAEAERCLQEKWDGWDSENLIPTENLPKGSKTSEPLRYGMNRWCDLFTPRQLLGHLTLVEGLNRLKPQILAELGEERGRAVVTYLQFAIDKGVDYNSRQTRWIPQRGIVSGTFGRHDFSLKWTFGEMIFTGPASGAAWGLSQVVDAYKGIAALLTPLHAQIQRYMDGWPPVRIVNGSAAYMAEVAERSVDLVCMDPPYYNNVQYAELSDYFYVWQRRTLADLYPELFNRRLTNKTEEAVANPARDGSDKNAKAAYERMMGEIFTECRRVVKDDGLMTLMFTHKSQDAWETLTRSLIEAGWTITASFPVDSEFGNSMHQKDMAAAASSIFISCRKRPENTGTPALWKGFGGGVQGRVRHTVEQSLRDFAPLNLNPVDRMVACYGRALQVLSEHWPVMEGDEPVSPIRAMNEASRVVAEHQVDDITGGRLGVEDLDPETGMALMAYGIWGHNEFAFDEALNLSRSLNLKLEHKTGGYRTEGQMIGVNPEAGGRRRNATEDSGYAAPLVRKGSKLRLARPEERDPRRLARPQTDWDRLHGLLMAYRQGDVPVAQAYLQQHAADRRDRVLDLLNVWIEEAETPELRKEAEVLRFGLS